MSRANCVSNSRLGKTAANIITTCGNVTAGAFFSTVGSCAPQKSGPASPRSYDDAIRSNPGLPHRPCPAVACCLQSTCRWATASHACVHGFPAGCQEAHGTERSSTPASRWADATPTRRQARARQPLRRPPAGPQSPPPSAPGCLPCSSDVSTPRRARPRPSPTLLAPGARPPPDAPAAGGVRAPARAAGGGRDVLPRPVSYGPLGKVPQAQLRHPIQKSRVPPKRLIRHHPLTPQGMTLHDGSEHLLRQCGLRFAGEVRGQATLPAPLRVCVVCQPFRRHRPPTLQHGGALSAPIANTHAGLAVGALAHLPAGLPLHAHRMDALLWKITAIDQQHAIVRPQVPLHFLPMLLHQPPIVPQPFTQEGLDGSHCCGDTPIHCEPH